MGLLLFYIALALGVSFLCSILEAVLLSITPSYVAAEEQSGHRNGQLWREYKNNIDRALAAILSLNTIAHTVGAAGAGAQATAVFGEIYFGVISAVLTLLILVVSEIIPKTLGAVYWRQLAPVCAPLLQFVIWSMYPLVILAKGITRLIARQSPHGSISREELAALADVSVSEGVLSEEESGVIQSMMRFRTLTARDIMTPRPVVFSLPCDKTLREVLNEHETLYFSRIPVYDGDTDNITGFVRKDDLLYSAVNAPPETTVNDIRRDLLSVLPSLPLLKLLRRMTLSNHQLALVVNEYGDVMGLVTMEDLVETMLGLEIVDETDTCTDMQLLARELWERRARQAGNRVQHHALSEEERDEQE